MAVFPSTDWGDWTSDEYDVGAPATSNHFERWFRNVVAAFQGAVDAPELQFAALGVLEPGTVIRSRIDQTQSGDNLAVHAFEFLQGGTIRVAFEYRHNFGSGHGNVTKVTRTRDGVSTVMGTWTTYSTTFQGVTIDVPVLAGDRIAVSQANLYTTGLPESRNVRFQTNGQKLWPGRAARVEN